ncbi:histidine--tRNA ligase [Clostridium cellulovorans]|uniref:Histidine--tRNA ligase n=1 Tax=Clostridium cellulovorans (strain ATCC 35296 / DSM 3052 / OCM 3 / 743B) TaxID=573061 RepID=D9SV94_CLOC7|nr:histidine--tRNA ligase [Clostridium cellulovorans]ADL53068.1 histidyl-tRNA synthetase [Clostridium cellulovorans 743B]
MNMDIIKPSILAGFMELLPKEQEIFNDIVDKITAVYKNNGCMAIDTPIIEKAEVLLAKNGGETEKQVYSFQKGKNNLALRFDLTVPFARYVAQYYNELTFPFRRYQLGKVYRGERNQKGRYREFYQCDVDVIGKDKLSINNDAWVISLADKAFKEIGLLDYQFQVSNRKVLKGILIEQEIENVTEIMILIDKYDKIDKKSFEDQITNIIGQEKSKYLNNILDIQGSNEEILAGLTKLQIKNEYFLEGINELRQVKAMLEHLDVASERFRINLKIIRGLDYYTGTVFETILIGNESYGSICSGGRYDNLAGSYTENLLPGVGISIGITRLFFVLKEIGFIGNYRIKNKLDYIIIPIGETLDYCMEVTKYLEKKGFGVTVYFEDNPLKKKMNYANKLGVEKVILIGEDERLNNEIKIKDMMSGDERKIEYRLL